MWGGTPDRNMVSGMKGLPTEWDVKSKKNIKWVADLGSQSYGNAVVAGGMVFVGTNNEGLRDPKQPGDRGVLMAFRETNGEFLWQHTHVKLEAGRANDWPYQGVASSPLVEGNRLYYVSNRAVLFCVDIEGFRDKENDGPVTDEKLTGMNDADVIWAFDMMEEVGIVPAQPRELVTGHVGRSDLRQHLERSGREPRERAVPARAVDHRRQQDERQACLGRQLGRRPHSARPVVATVDWHDRRRRPGCFGARGRLGARIRGANRQEAVGVRYEPEGMRCGRKRATSLSRRRSSSAIASISRTGRIPSTAKESATSTPSTQRSAAISRRVGPALALRRRSADRFPLPP